MDSQLPKCLSCPICYEVYDEQTRLPIIIPCGNGHTICATCVVNTWGEDGKFCCPFDKVELYYYNGIVNELAKNRVVLDALEELKRDYCSKHPNRKLDLICNTCQSTICSACQLRGSHEGHEVVLIEEFNEEVEKGSKRIRNILGEIDKIFEKILNVVNQRQTVLHDMISSKFKLHGDKLKPAKEAMKTQIEAHFKEIKEEINANVFNHESETQILAWKSKAKEVANKNSRKKSVDDDFEIINQFKMISALDIEKWLEEKKVNIPKLEAKLEEMWIEFQREFEANIDKEDDFKARYNTFMDTINAEISRECESPTKILTKKKGSRLLEDDDLEESTTVTKTSAPAKVKVGQILEVRDHNIKNPDVSVRQIKTSNSNLIRLNKLNLG